MCALADVSEVSINPIIRAHLTKMIIKFVQKRCARCQELFNIPNVKQSPIRDILLEFSPCTHCGYVKTPTETDIKNNVSGRCQDCSIPFSIIDHHGKGRCHRCFMIEHRKNVTKSNGFDNIINNGI